MRLGFSVRFLIGLGVVVLAAAPAAAQAIITNGSGLAVGISETGAMGVFGIVPAEAGAPATSADYLAGLSFVSDYGGGLEWRDATTPGCMCEGFGVSASGMAGFDSNDNGVGGLTVIDAGGTLTGSGSTASFATLVGFSGLPGLTVAHDYHPSLSPSLYEATVTIANGTGGALTDVRYVRVMDWDIPPTEFSEFVTNQGSGLGDLELVTDNGFASANPLVAPGGTEGNIVDLGPTDHGAYFRFNFGDLAVGESKTFQIYYGAAAGEAAALAALAVAGAQGIYSFGQQAEGATTGLPATFIFGFGGVGAPPIDPDPDPVPEPVSMLLLGGGLAGVLVRRYRRR